VHAAGGVQLSRFEREPYIAQLDYVGAEHTLAAARAVRAKYVLVSCDWVHSGYRPAGVSFNEIDLPDPVNAYGRSKLACEEATMRANVRWLITRPADVYGVNMARPLRARGARLGSGERERVEPEKGERESGHVRYVWEHSGTTLQLVGRLREHMTLPAPAGLQRSPTYAWDYAERLCELVAQGCEGVYNMGGPVSLGRHEWLELLASQFSCSRELVPEGTKAAYLQACGEDPRLRVPANTALSDEKARAAIGCAAVAPQRGVGLMYEQLTRMLKPNGLPAR
jgi:dTDP-4-dehydrorhamnose reductase